MPFENHPEAQHSRRVKKLVARLPAPGCPPQVPIVPVGTELAVPSSTDWNSGSIP